MPSPLDDLRAVVDAVQVPVQAVGGLSIEQAIACPKHGAPLVVLGVGEDLVVHHLGLGEARPHRDRPDDGACATHGASGQQCTEGV